MQAVISRRVQAAALLLPLLGVFLLMPPFVSLFGGPTRVFGVPLVVFYLFAVWVALTVAAALLARRLPLSDTAPVRDPTADAGATETPPP